jgi:hypothetical protein
MILTLLLMQHVAGHVDVDGMDTSVSPADDILAKANDIPHSYGLVLGSAENRDRGFVPP